MVFLQVEASRNNEFKRAFEKIVIDTNALTQEYTIQEDQWLSRDNNTMVQVIDQYLPKYDMLVEKAKALEKKADDVRDGAAPAPAPAPNN